MSHITKLVVEPTQPNVQIAAEGKYDLIVVGAGIAGSALACAFGKQGRNVLLIERDLSEPDRIVGELLQPGGVTQLHALGMADCLEGIDASDVYGYGVFLDNGGKSEGVQLPYPLFQGDKIIGRSFHHGRFIQKLRAAARSAPNVTLIQAAVTSLAEDASGAVIGASFKEGENTYTAKAPLTIVCDGCFSNFRRQMSVAKPVTHSYFVGLILEDIQLPYPNHGHVFLANPGPILGYQIGSNEVRILVDVPGPLPSVANGELAEYLRNQTAPQLPVTLREAFLKAISEKRLRSMPNSRLHPTEKAIRPGVLLVGDAWNMRHPLTGGGMTVAFHDVVQIRNALASLPSFDNREAVMERLQSEYIPKRKPLASTINILAFALHSVFAASDDPILPLMRKACFNYFKLGGTAVSGPISLLAGMCTKPTVLIYHFFSVAVYGTIRHLLPFPWPSKIIECYRLLAAASWIVIPLMRGEKVFGFFTSILSLIFRPRSRSLTEEGSS